MWLIFMVFMYIGKYTIHGSLQGMTLKQQHPPSKEAIMKFLCFSNDCIISAFLFKKPRAEKKTHKKQPCQAKKINPHGELT